MKIDIQHATLNEVQETVSHWEQKGKKVTLDVAHATLTIE